jgi:hypothetical protein
MARSGRDKPAVTIHYHFWRRVQCGGFGGEARRSVAETEFHFRTTLRCRDKEGALGDLRRVGVVIADRRGGIGS